MPKFFSAREDFFTTEAQRSKIKKGFQKSFHFLCVSVPLWLVLVLAFLFPVTCSLIWLRLCRAVYE